MRCQLPSLNFTFLCRNPFFKFRTPDCAIRYVPDLLFRTPSTTCSLQAVPKRVFRITDGYRDTILIPETGSRLPRLFLNYDLDGLQPYSAAFIVAVPDIQQRLSVLVDQLLRSLLARLQIQSRLHASSRQAPGKSTDTVRCPVPTWQTRPIEIKKAVQPNQIRHGRPCFAH